ncbi:MAG TPA: LysR family transcriptional regulator [Paenirhodobacter sp.]
MDWDDLRFFLAVARQESISAAGRTLKCDAATVGRRIARFEEGLGIKLFVKSSHGYLPTEAGRRLLPHAEVAEQAMASAQEEISGTADGLSGQVRIAAPDGCANYILPQVCAAIGDANPGLEIQILALPRIVNLSKREADFAIAVSRPTGGRLTVQKLCDYHLHLAADRDYLARHPPLRSRADLGGHRMIGYIPDMIFDHELDYLAETGAKTVALASNSMAVQMQLLRSGAGLGIAHDFALPACPGVTRILTAEVTLRRTFWLIRHADDRRSNRLSRLGEALSQGMRTEVARLEMLAAEQ